MKWLKKLDMKGLYWETLEEHMVSYEEQTAKTKQRFDKQVEEIAAQEIHQEKIKRLGCFLGIKTHIALSLMVKTGAFQDSQENSAASERIKHGWKYENIPCHPKRTAEFRAAFGHSEILCQLSLEQY